MNGGILANELRQRVELLALRFDGEHNSWYWEVQKTLWAGVNFEEKRNLFSSIGIGARSANIVIRAQRELTLHQAMRLGTQFLFLTAIVLSDDKRRQDIRAAVCESVTLTARPQSRKGRDGNNRPTAIEVPAFTFPGILTERYFRNEEDEFYRAEMQQRALVTPKTVVLRAGDLIQQEGETPYTVREVLELDPFKNEYVIERRWEA